MSFQSRRQFLEGGLALTTLSLLSGCGSLLTSAGHPGRVYRIGFLSSATETATAPNLEAFRRGLVERGYVEERDIALDIRYADGRADRLPDLVSELVRANVDVILTSGLDAIRASQKATDVIPIVFAAGSDPVANGLVTSLARPGGITTGLSISAGHESAKRLQLLKDVFPGLARVAVLWNQPSIHLFRDTEVAAATLGVQLTSLEVESPDTLNSLLTSAVGQADALITTDAVLFASLAPQIVSFASTNGLPAMYGQVSFPRQGGLMAYGPNISDNFRRAAAYVDKILKGAQPSDLPVEQPTVFDFVINLKTAQALGLAIPPPVLAQATEIIQ